MNCGKTGKYCFRDGAEKGVGGCELSFDVRWREAIHSHFFIKQRKEGGDSNEGFRLPGERKLGQSEIFTGALLETPLLQNQEGKSLFPRYRFHAFTSGSEEKRERKEVLQLQHQGKHPGARQRCPGEGVCCTLSRGGSCPNRAISWMSSSTK